MGAISSTAVLKGLSSTIVDDPTSAAPGLT
jgi:hypothetical protein